MNMYKRVYALSRCHFYVLVVDYIMLDVVSLCTSEELFYERDGQIDIINDKQY